MREGGKGIETKEGGREGGEWIETGEGGRGVDREKRGREVRG